ncbi:MAG: GspE/PulE family protein [Aureliella sp.]
MSSLTLPPRGGLEYRPARLAPERNLPLGERLYRAGVLTAEELEAALNQHVDKKLQFGETLLELGFVDEDTLLRFLGAQMQVSSVRIREGMVDPAVVRLLPRPKAEALCAIAMFCVRKTLTVAMAEPRDLQLIDEIERITGLRVRPVLALKSNIVKILPRCYENNFTVDAVTADLAHDAVQVENEAFDIDMEDVDAMADGSPIINLVNYLIYNAVRQNASDIHVEPGTHCTTVRFRVDGSLREALRPRREFHPAIVSRLKVMAKLDIGEHRLPQDGRIHVRIDGREIDLRVSTVPTILGQKVVMRVLDRKNVTFNLDQLGVPAPLLSKMKNMLARPHGLLLVTGPTGSGKTTTLYSALELIKSVNHNIVTVEDPVEYQLDQINQIPVGSNKAMSFAGALRAILRQDPDIIMLGEIRDSETAAVAVQAALTGHLVLSTLHTNDSFGAVTRLHDMGVEPFKVAASLVGVIAQRLVRTVCQACKTVYYPSDEVFDLLHYQGDRRRQFVHGKGCRVCYDTGLRGRVGIYEVMQVSREMRSIIARGGDVEEVRALHRNQGGSLLLDEGIALAESGRTSLDEVLRVAYAE